MSTIRRYSELIRLSTFEERFDYLSLHGEVGTDTFGFDRYMNQMFYKSAEWKRIRDYVIVRDSSCDLGIPGRDIHTRIVIHHMNPINPDDIKDSTDYLLNPDYLITTTHNTHNAIHYGDINLLAPSKPTVRTPNDTCPWRKEKY